MRCADKKEPARDRALINLVRIEVSKQTRKSKQTPSRSSMYIATYDLRIAVVNASENAERINRDQNPDKEPYTLNLKPLNLP